MPVRCVQGAQSQGPIINGLYRVPRPSEEPERAATLAPAASAGGNPRCDAIGTVVACGADLSREGTEDSSPAAPAQNDRGGGCDSDAPALCGRRHLHLLQVQVGIPVAARSGPSSRVGPPDPTHRNGEGPARAIGGASGEAHAGPQTRDQRTRTPANRPDCKPGPGGVMKRPWFLRGTVLSSGQGAFSSPC